MLTATIFALTLSQGPPNVPGPPPIPKIALQQEIKKEVQKYEQKPYLVAWFVNTPLREIDGLHCVAASTLNGNNTPRILVGLVNEIGQAMPPNASDQELRRASVVTEERQVSRAALPFVAKQLAQPDANYATGPWPESVKRPEGLLKYTRARFTQRISVTNGRDAILPVPRENVDNEWLHSGGLRGVRGWKSDVYKYVPEGASASAYVANLPVWNGSNFQYNRGYYREYPNGTQFFDILSNTETGRVFEAREASKKNGNWTRRVVFTDAEQRPHGYTGLTQSCASCHDHNPGTGGYAVGMIPGSDTVFSDPFPALER